MKTSNFFFLIYILLIQSLAFSQQEASVWYFGQNAGIKFESNGTITTLTDGQLSTAEGCATLADANGNLLLYTDGITVWNRNHGIMPNGTGLLGDSSSTQSATIVPMPGSNTLFYVFTLDAYAETNGFRYSIVDMSLDGGNGAVTSSKNVLIYSPTCEKLAIVRHANNLDYWIVTHGWENSTFYSHLLSSTGLSNAPVITNIGEVVNGVTDNTWGYMKISPNGNKLVICNSSINAELFDFDINTGILSNPLVLHVPINGFVYGAEFSPNSNILYLSIITYNPYPVINQYDLNSNNIPSTETTIYSSSTYIATALQLGPNNKLYFGEFYEPFLGVINDPNEIGVSCNPQINAVNLLGRDCELGLPPFVSSFFFTPAIQFDNSCTGENIQFQFNSSQPVLSTSWNFGDGTTSNAISPSHTYSIAGDYTVSVQVTTPLGVGTNTRNIAILPKPILLQNTVSLKQCDDDNDGFSAFNLTEANSLLVNDPTGLVFTYYETLVEAENNTNPISNPIAYTNQTVSIDQLFVRITNSYGCASIATLNLIISTTQISNTIQETFTVCDDDASGSTTDGIATFDFSSANAQIVAQYPSGQLLDITYYRNLADALAEQNAIADISNYTNIGYPNAQNIYVRVDSRLNNECLGLGHHITLHVERVPIVQSQSYNHCDDDQDGLYAFDTTTLQSDLLNGLINVTVSYFDITGNPIAMTNPFVTSSQVLTVRVSNNTNTACYYETTVTFTVDDLPEAFAIPANLTTVCDDEVNPSLQNGLYAFDTSSFQSTILGTQTGMQVMYYDPNGNALSSPLPNPFVSSTQNILVEVINPINTTCTATITIPFVVLPVPEIELQGDGLVCSDNTTFTLDIDAGLLDSTTLNNYTYQWYLNGVLLVNETNYDLTVNTEGVYTVTVTNTNNCSKMRTITVTASDVATITEVEITDFSDNNSIVISVDGGGTYEYSLDNSTYQTSNVFTNLEAGIYTVYVNDIYGCGITTEEISILGIPKFFTPNGDGFNDTWNIQGVNNQSNGISTISIFDRYGKLLKEISAFGQGWDGLFNGQEMPSTDYWYSVTLENGKVIKGHFTLKR
ncbi:MAG: T9SS type B sorting domain-containing protein [Flavobacterium sp.]|nr:T9SS type B sorting domain-containing protein [Flavobacterium sp.]